MKKALDIFLIIILATLVGCQPDNARSVSGYETIAGETLRDSDAARRYNADGLSAIDNNDFGEAEQAFKRALEADVMFGPAHNNLGKLYHTQELYYKAAWEYQYAIKLMPYHPEPKYNLGLVYESVGKLDQAIALYDQAIIIEPDNPLIIGNYLRARFKRGDQSPDMYGLLTDLVLRDTRPEWLAWAREKMALLPKVE